LFFYESKIELIPRFFDFIQNVGKIFHFLSKTFYFLCYNK
jgi:hypothetical protein